MSCPRTRKAVLRLGQIRIQARAEQAEQTEGDFLVA